MTVVESANFMPRYELIMQQQNEPNDKPKAFLTRPECYGILRMTMLNKEHKPFASTNCRECSSRWDCERVIREHDELMQERPWGKKYEKGDKHICLNCRKATEAYLHSMHGICSFSNRLLDARRNEGFKCNKQSGETCPREFQYNRNCVGCQYFSELSCWEPNNGVPARREEKAPDKIYANIRLPDGTWAFPDDQRIARCPVCNGVGDVRAWVDKVAIAHCMSCANEWRIQR